MRLPQNVGKRYGQRKRKPQVGMYRPSMLRHCIGQAGRRVQPRRTKTMDRGQRLRARCGVPPGILRPHRGHRRPRRTALPTSPKRLQRQQRVGVYTGPHTRSGSSTIYERDSQSTNLALRPGNSPNSRSSKGTGSRQRVLWQLIRPRHRVQRRGPRPTTGGTIATQTSATPAGRQAQRGKQSPTTVGATPSRTLATPA